MIEPQQKKIEAGGSNSESRAEIHDRTGLFVSIAAIAAAFLSLGLALWARGDAERAEREARMLEFYVLELDAKLVAAGYKTDSESIAKRLKQEKQRQ